jgi:hypothetical protein
VSEERRVDISIDQVTLLAPLMAGHVLSAYYAALLLKAQTGAEMTDEIRADTLSEVLLAWANIQQLITEKLPKKEVSLGTVRYQGP